MICNIFSHFVDCLFILLMVSFAECSKVNVLAAQLCLTLCNPMDFCSPAGSSVHGILQARILQWVAISFSRGSSWSRDQTLVSLIAGKFFTIWPISEASQKNLRGYIKQWREYWPPGSLGQWFLKDRNKPGGGLPALPTRGLLPRRKNIQDPTT